MFYIALGLAALGIVVTGFRASKELHNVAINTDVFGDYKWGWADVRYSVARLGGPTLLALAFLALLVAR